MTRVHFGFAVSFDQFDKTRCAVLVDLGVDNSVLDWSGCPDSTTPELPL